MRKTFDEFEEWRSGRVHRDKAPVIPAARGFRIQGKDNQRAVLLIHGYAGYPGELVSPAAALAKAGFDVYVPRLPGMGTSGADFLKTRRYDWMAVVDKALAFLCGNYPEVSVAGHSMGCLLAVLAERSHKISKIVLAMPAFEVPGLDRRKLRFGRLLKKDIAVPWASDSRYRMHYEGAPRDDAKLGAEYYSHLYTPCLYELAILSEEADKAFSGSSTPALVISGGEDKVISNEGIKRHWGRRNAEFLHIPSATHFVYYDPDPEAEDQAVKATVDFLS